MKTWATGESLLAADLNANFAEVAAVAAVIQPFPLYPYNAAAVTKTINVNTTGWVGAFSSPNTITINKISFSIGAVAVAGTIKIGIYSADGQTRYLNETSASISATGRFTHTLSSPLYLPSGQYYFVVIPIGTTNVDIHFYNVISTISANLNAPTSEPKLYGTLSVTAGTLPTTFNPSTNVTDSTTGGLPIMRFDN